jgi:hypothetical protein
VNVSRRGLFGALGASTLAGVAGWLGTSGRPAAASDPMPDPSDPAWVVMDVAQRYGDTKMTYYQARTTADELMVWLGACPRGAGTTGEPDGRTR